MLASTQRAAQRRGISEGGPARRRWRGSKERPQAGNWGGRRRVAGTLLATRAVPAAASAARRAEVGRGDDDGQGPGAGGRAVAPRAARAQRSWVAVGCWCWSVGARVSSPLAPGTKATPGRFLPRAGCARRASPPPAGVTDALGTPLPTCARRPAAPPCASEARGKRAGAGSPRPERRARPPRGGLALAGAARSALRLQPPGKRGPCFSGFPRSPGGSKPKNEGHSIGRLLIKHLLLPIP